MAERRKAAAKRDAEVIEVFRCSGCGLLYDEELPVVRERSWGPNPTPGDDQPAMRWVDIERALCANCRGAVNSTRTP